MGWYLVLIATQAYLGPFSQPSCQMAAATLRSDGVVCQQAISNYYCESTGRPRPGAGAVCPTFDAPPQVRIK